MKKFWQDFKAFISKGNVLDLAVGVIIGGAFGKITSSLVNDIIMPLISLATGGVAVSDWKWVITPADPVAGIAESALYYGNFIQTVLDFLIIAFTIFLMLRIIMKSREGFGKLGNLIKKSVKKNKKKKKGQVEEVAAEEVEQVAVVETPAEVVEQAPVVEEAKADPVVEAQPNELAETVAKITAANEKQEALLTEIRDLLAKQLEAKKD